MRERLAALRREDGYVMVTVMGVLLVATLFSVAALAAADKDIPQSREDIDRKAALQAAEAGLNYYLYHLNEDNSFWAQCADVEEPNQPDAPVNQPWNRTGADNRVWRNVAGSPDTQFTVELLPVSGPNCNKSDPVNSMIDRQSGTFRIRVTGRSAARRNGRWTYRTLNANFRRNGFLDYLYFTNWETSPPSAYAFRGDTDICSGSPPTCVSAESWAAANCSRWRRQGREDASARVADDPDGVKNDPLECNRIQFAPGDVINGPMHTNDNILTCGNPTFGRTVDGNNKPVTDKVTVSDPRDPGYETACAGAPNVRPAGNKLQFGQPELTLPPSNGSLSSIASPKYTFTGETTIDLLDTGQIEVTDHSGPGGQLKDHGILDWPGNGVIYVKNGACTTGSYNLIDPYNVSKGCATTYVSGTYKKSLTIGSARDIVVRPEADDPDNSGVIRSGDAMLGLIANDHVRVYHQVRNRRNNGQQCDEESPSTGSRFNIRIDAAILALNYSFIVDNYYCGSKRGTLTVNGVIAQKYRGPVGTSGAAGTGYIKNYVYDDRLVYRSPPYFLDPVQSAWQIIRYAEQTPAWK